MSVSKPLALRQNVQPSCRQNKTQTLGQLTSRQYGVTHIDEDWIHIHTTLLIGLFFCVFLKKRDLRDVEKT